jgi:hypothetical protein
VKGCPEHLDKLDTGSIWRVEWGDWWKFEFLAKRLDLARAPAFSAQLACLSENHGQAKCAGLVGLEAPVLHNPFCDRTVYSGVTRRT